jgi:ribulose-bisphosphate carboxylase large chain
MCDILTVGWAGLQTLRKETQDLKLAIHAHRAFHAAFDRNPKHGMSMAVVAKIARLIGVDNIHIGTVIGKLIGTKDDVLQIEDEITMQIEKPLKSEKNVLNQSWFGLKDTIPVSSGGLHPGLIPLIINMLGKDIVIQLGGGIHGHPQGTLAGAKASRQAIESVMKKIPLKRYAKDHTELNSALKKWKFSKPI